MQAESEDVKDRIKTSIVTHSVVSWRHLILLGEYDFSDEKLQDNVGILSPKLAARKSSRYRRRYRCKKYLCVRTFNNPMSRYVPLCKMTQVC